MKRTIIPTLILLFIIIVSCSRQGNKFPQGDWLRVDRIKVNGDSITHDIDLGGNIKMWSDKRFMFLGKYKNDTAEVDAYGGGKYNLEKNHYEEDIEMHMAKNLVGQKIKMLLEMKNDTLVQTYPVDDNWQVTIKPYYIEKYVKGK